MSHVVYTLSDPRTGEVRYVGATSYPLQDRLARHCTPSALRKHNHKNHWVSSLLQLGLRPVISEVESYSSAELMFKMEDFWIEHFRSQGADLVNGSDGGKGSPGPKSAEHRAKLAQAQTGKKLSEETREKMSAAHKARWTNRPRREIVDQNGHVYASVKAAAEEVGASLSNVYEVLRGRWQQVHGYKFSWVESQSLQQAR